MLAIWTHLRRHLADFRRANAGNVAMTFALASLPLIGTVGFAVDYSHANAVKAAMQAALTSGARRSAMLCPGATGISTMPRMRARCACAMR